MNHCLTEIFPVYNLKYDICILNKLEREHSQMNSPVFFVLFVSLLWMKGSCLDSSRVPAFYHTTPEIHSIIQTICRPTWWINCHNDYIQVTGTDRSHPVHLLVFGEHARELISSEIALNLIQHMQQHQPTASYLIIPVANTWGRQTVERGNFCLRVNENGVDLNRNYEVSSSKPGSDTYGGSHPFSEHIPLLIKRLLNEYDVKKYMTIHSGERALYTPYDDSTKHPPNYTRMLHTVQEWKRKYCRDCVVGEASVVSNYRCRGTAVDYSIHHQLVEEAYTLEVYGADSSHCLARFNPLEIMSYNRVIRNFVSLLLEV